VFGRNGWYLLNGRNIHMESLHEFLAKQGEDNVWFQLASDNGKYASRSWAYVEHDPDAAAKLDAFWASDLTDEQRKAYVSPWTVLPHNGRLLVIREFGKGHHHDLDAVEAANKKLAAIAEHVGLKPVADSWSRHTRFWIKPKRGNGVDASGGSWTETAPAEELPPPALVDLMDFEEAEDRQWLAPGYLLVDHVTLCAAKPGTGKSAYALHAAIALAAGIEWCGWRPVRPVKVLYLNLEDDRKELHRRIVAACTALGVDRRKLRGRLFTLDVNRLDLVARDGEDRRSRPKATPLAGQIMEIMKANKIEAIMLDPMIELHSGLDENSNTDMKEIIVNIRDIARGCHAGALVVHHTRKGAANGDIEGARGGSAISGAVRVGLTLDLMDDKTAGERAISEQERWRYISVTSAKENYALAGQRVWIEKRSVPHRESVDGGETSPGLFEAEFKVWHPEDMHDLSGFLIALAKGCGVYKDGRIKHWRAAKNATEGRMRDLLLQHGVTEKRQPAVIRALVEHGYMELGEETDGHRNKKPVWRPKARQEERPVEREPDPELELEEAR